MHKAFWMAGAALLALTMTGNAAPKRNDAVYKAAEAARPAVIDLLKEIVNIDSGTGDVAGGNKIAALLSARLTALGASVRSEKAEAPNLPDNLVATFKGTGKGRVLLIAHLDTVFGPGTVAARPFSIEGTRAHGPGVVDEKAGLALAVSALTLLHDLKYKNFATVTLLVDTSEEQGSTGSMRLIKSLAAQHDVEFNMEPGGDNDELTVWRKGSSRIRIQVKGRAAHAGVEPQAGRNAAIELIHQIDSIAGAFPLSGDGTTLNLTVLKSGERPNIIPDAAEATFSARFRGPNDLPQIVAKLEAAAKTTAIPDTSVSVSASPGFPPLIQNADTDALAKHAQGVYAELGLKIGTGGNGGASESAVAQSAGTPALDGLGLPGGDAHTDHEWADLNLVVPRLYLITRLIMDMGAKPPKRAN
ncbi:MAG: glutamate carboxypeptidase [Alphaproteobacteria bacterium]